MPHLSAICILVVVSVLVQNASGKRGCAAFGHACYGGHGKRSSSLSENLIFGGSSGSSSTTGGNGPLGAIPPLPYAKLALINRSKTFDDASPELRLVNAQESDDRMESYVGRQDKFERSVRYAVNAILRQLLEESQRQPPVESNNFQPSEAGQQQAPSLQLDNEKK
ncbi:uncharacterized protein LOC5565599 [Aedes aegypti]|uniref:Uncharacterized protein n=1 Tax=Aedes aegypti TaxID=7159 RepID=A0A6I8TU66_AEDAE|nr:uncharacterized protein LOC5565599 [Aedes aegypti]